MSEQTISGTNLYRFHGDLRPDGAERGPFAVYGGGNGPIWVVLGTGPETMEQATSRTRT